MLNFIFKVITFFLRKVRYIFNFGINNILYLPVVESKKDLSYIVNSIAATIPYRKDLVINIVVNKELLNTDFNDLEILEFQGDYVHNTNLAHINLIEYSFKYIINADLICVTDESCFNKLIFFRYKTQILFDTDNNSIISEFYKTINYSINNRVKNTINLNKSKKVFNRLLEEKYNAQKSIVIAGGPSIKRHKEFEFNENDFVISMNDYVIKDLKFMDYIKMDAVSFRDPALFFGASKYTKEFYDILIKAFNYKKFYIFIDISTYDIIKSFGIFDDYLIGIDMQTCKSYRLLSKDNLVLSLYPIANSLTRFAGSIALSLSNKVLFLGADGMKENDMKKINKNYSDRRKFAYQNYNLEFPHLYKTYKSALESSDIYNMFLEQFIKFADPLNKEIYTLVESNYKALSTRIWKGDNDAK